MDIYYNDNDKYCCQKLRGLIKANLIPNGIIDGKSIKDVDCESVRGKRQCHFFAGIAGWELALQLANWPREREVWTVSCPCQPFSQAGVGDGLNDPRHLWPEILRLVRECKPGIIFGEQVERAIKSKWLDVVFNELEEQGYACGAIVLPACSIGASHVRQRIWWVADASSKRWRDVKCERNSAKIFKEMEQSRFGGDLIGSRDELETSIVGILYDDGISLEMERIALRQYGNSIVPGLAAEFISAFMESYEDQ